jgi:hypothetical protein
MGATCADAQTHMHSRRIPSQEYDRNGAESGGAVAFPSEWRPLLRSDRLLGLPVADRQSLGCSPAIEGPSPRYPPKHARFSGRMSGRRLRNPRGDQIGRARGRRRANEGKVRENDAYGPRSRGLQFLRGESGWTVHSSYLRKAGAGRGRRGDATRPRLRGESQDV